MWASTFIALIFIAAELPFGGTGEHGKFRSYYFRTDMYTTRRPACHVCVCLNCELKPVVRASKETVKMGAVTEPGGKFCKCFVITQNDYTDQQREISRYGLLLLF